MSDSKAREAAASGITVALKNAADKIYWWDGADAEKVSGGEPEWTEYAGGIMLADRFDMQAIANAAIDAYITALKAEGFAVMPREAYNAMWNAGDDMMPSADELVAGIEEYGEAVFYEIMPGPGKIWTAMFDAYKEDKAPTPPAETPTGQR